MSRAVSRGLSIFQRAKQKLTNKFSHFAPEPVIANLKRTNGLAAIRRKTERDGKWLVVGFHRVIYVTLRRTVAIFSGLKRNAGMQ